MLLVPLVLQSLLATPEHQPKIIGVAVLDVRGARLTGSSRTWGVKFTAEQVLSRVNLLKARMTEAMEVTVECPEDPCMASTGGTALGDRERRSHSSAVLPLRRYSRRD